MRVNLGCGKQILKGWINLDYIKEEGIDIVHDLNNYPWPFKSNSIDEILADNILEHLNDFARALKEIHRILKKNGTILIKVPYFSNPGAFTPFHRTFFNFNSLDFYCSNIPQGKDLKQSMFEMIERKIIFLDNYYKNIFLKMFYLFPKLVYKISPKIYIWFLTYLFPASEIHFKLKKI